MTEQEKRRVLMRMVIAQMRKLDARQMLILWYFTKNLGRRRNEEMKE